MNEVLILSSFKAWINLREYIAIQGNYKGAIS